MKQKGQISPSPQRKGERGYGNIQVLKTKLSRTFQQCLPSMSALSQHHSRAAW